MAQINAILNFCVVAVVVVTAVVWVGTPGPPKPLPNDAHFVAQIQQPGTVLVKFGADWCPPCRGIEQELDALVHADPDHVTVVKINIDQNRALAQHYQVTSIPHLVLFHNGKQVDTAKGYRTREQLKAWIATTH